MVLDVIKKKKNVETLLLQNRNGSELLKVYIDIHSRISIYFIHSYNL